MAKVKKKKLSGERSRAIMALLFLYSFSENLKDLPSPKVFSLFSNNFVEMFIRWPSIRFLQAMLIGRKTWPPEGWGYFAFYGYNENLKYPLLRFWNNFAETFLGWHSTRFLLAMVVGKKHGHQGAGLFGDLIFALWPWSDTGPLRPLVSSSCWNCLWCVRTCKCVSVNFLLQTASPWPLGQFGWNFIGSILSMFSPSWLVKKHGRQGQGSRQFFGKRSNYSWKFWVMSNAQSTMSILIKPF